MSDSGSTGRTSHTSCTSSNSSNSSNGSAPFSTSTPSSANAEDGKLVLRKDLRSVVMSRLAYRMCRYFHGKEEIKVDQKVSDRCDSLFLSATEYQDNTCESARIPRGLPPRSPSPSVAHVTTAMAVTSLESAKEPNITKKLAEKMGEFISELNVTDQWQLNKDVSGDRTAAGRPDLLFVKPKSSKVASQEGKSEENERDVIALLEVGIQKTSKQEDFSLWMSKLGQGSIYLKEMAKDGTTGPVNSTLKNVDGTNPKFRGPALLGIVTFDEKRTFMNVGVFCCEPLDRPNSFRMALMYREQVQKREQMAKAFAKIVKGIVAFNSVRDIPNDFTYLGPNCAKVTMDDQVTVSLRLDFDAFCPGKPSLTILRIQ